MNNQEAIEAWSKSIREACEKHQKFLEEDIYGTHGVCCCAASSIVFDPNRKGVRMLNQRDVETKLRELFNLSSHAIVVEFIKGVIWGFDGLIYREFDDIFKQGFELGKEMREKYLTKEER